MNQIIDGKSFAEQIRHKVADRVQTLKVAHSVIPSLAVVLVGEDPASTIYVRNKAKAAEEVGIRSIVHRLDTQTTQAKLLWFLSSLNRAPDVHGILVQLPLPPHIDTEAIIEAVDPAKDVDGFHPQNAGYLANGMKHGLVPCTPAGCMMLLRDRLRDLSGQRALVIGASRIVGRPMAALLLRADCTVTVAHVKTRELIEECRRADIIVTAVGQPEMIRGDWLRPGATVIDVGMNRTTTPDGRTHLVGDVAFQEALPVVAGITPVPGGVGPMTVACLLQNTVLACEAQL